MIGKLLRISDQVIQDLTVQKYIDHKINQKRRLTSVPSDDVDEIEALSLNAKKLKVNNPLQMLKSGKLTETRFSLQILCNAKLDKYLPFVERDKTSFWNEETKEDVFILKRDDFLKLPNDLIVKISKEHAKLRGWKKQVEKEEGKMAEEVSYQIIDSSINGTYYLGNILEGFSKQKPMKLKGGVPFQLRHGDRIGILMDKETKTNEMLVGFEFQITKDDDNNDEIIIE